MGGVVGHQVVQTGEVSVVGGHQYAVAGVETIPQPAVSSIAGPPVNTVETRPLPPPVIPHAAPYVAAIPPAPTNQGPAPADTVVQQKILAPVRPPMSTTPPTTSTLPRLSSLLTPPPSTRPSMFPSTPSRPTSFPELPTFPPSPLTPPTPWSDTLPSPLLTESSELLTESSELLMASSEPPELSPIN